MTVVRLIACVLAGVLSGQVLAPPPPAEAAPRPQLHLRSTPPLHDVVLLPPGVKPTVTRAEALRIAVTKARHSGHPYARVLDALAALVKAPVSFINGKTLWVVSLSPPPSYRRGSYFLEFVDVRTGKWIMSLSYRAR
jgi:hypothetical protein